MQDHDKAAALATAEQFLTDLGVSYSRQADGSLFVGGSLDVANKQLTVLPDLSMVDVNDDFFCDGNQLTTLAGAPRSVAGAFDCSNNKLTSLVGAPETCAAFMCANNALTSLKGAPQSVLNFYCDGNQLTDLAGGPVTTPGAYDCSNNALASLSGAPPNCREFLCAGNKLVCLQGAPRGFEKLVSDFGTFASWNAVPDDIRTPDAHNRRQREAAIEEAIPGFTILAAPLRVGKSLKFR